MKTQTAMLEAWLEELTFDECLSLLRTHDLGRIAVVAGEFPIVVPLTYTLVESGGRNWIALRTRPGSVIDQGSTRASFQIDGSDPVQRRGWSVLVRGTLQRVNPDAAGFRDRFDPEPWIESERDAWLILEPFEITGRRPQRPRPPVAHPSHAYL